MDKPKRRPRLTAWPIGDDEWPPDLMSGSAGYVSGERQADPPKLLVPDGHGGYRDHEVRPKPKGRMGF